jgi:hypothetical protein
MILHVTSAEYVSGHKIRLAFNDGTKGVADLAGKLSGPVFEPLRALREFRRFRLDPILNTVVWANGADLAPEFLRSLITKVPKSLANRRRPRPVNRVPKVQAI